MSLEKPRFGQLLAEQEKGSKIDTSELTGKLDDLFALSAKAKPEEVEEDQWFHGRYRSIDRSTDEGSKSEPEDPSGPSLEQNIVGSAAAAASTAERQLPWDLSQGDIVRRALTSHGLEKYCATLKELGVATAQDLANPCAVSDGQLKRACKMPLLSIKRFRRVSAQIAAALLDLPQTSDPNQVTAKPFLLQAPNPDDDGGSSSSGQTTAAAAAAGMVTLSSAETGVEEVMTAAEIREHISEVHTVGR